MAVEDWIDIGDWYSFEEDPQFIQVHENAIVFETDKAILYRRWDGKGFWVPKSVSFFIENEGQVMVEGFVNIDFIELKKRV